MTGSKGYLGLTRPIATPKEHLKPEVFPETFSEVARPRECGKSDRESREGWDGNSNTGYLGAMGNLSTGLLGRKIRMTGCFEENCGEEGAMRPAAG